VVLSGDSVSCEGAGGKREENRWKDGKGAPFWGSQKTSCVETNGARGKNKGRKESLMGGESRIVNGKSSSLGDGDEGPRRGGGGQSRRGFANSKIGLGRNLSIKGGGKRGVNS